MDIINHFNLRSFDLNLMICFDALFQELSVTKAAQRLRVTQPAMSHSLSCLRMLLEDDLFVRVGAKMEPTPRACELATPIRELLAASQNTLLGHRPFNPKKDERTFRLGLSDQLQALILPGLVARLRQEAPHIKLMTKATSRETVFDMLDTGAVDFTIGSFNAEPSWARKTTLFSEEHVCCFNPQYVSIRPPVDKKSYIRTPHALVSRKAESMFGYLEDALRRAGITPNVVFSTTNFFTLLLLTSQSSVICTVPARLTNRYARALGLVISPLPFKLEDFQVELLWHQRNASEQSFDWMRTLLTEVSKELD